MKTLHLSIISSLLTVLIFSQTALAQTSPHDIMQDYNAPMTKLSSNGAVLIINQTIDKLQFKMGEPIVVHPEMVNLGESPIFVANGLPLFHIEVRSENDTKVFDSGYSGMLIVGWGFTLNPGGTESDNGTWGSWPKAGTPVVHIDVPGKYEILSESNISLYRNSHDFYYNTYQSKLLSLWSKPLEITVLPLTFAQNASMSPNVIKTPNGGWVTPLQTHEKNGSNLTIHYEKGSDVTGKIMPTGPPPQLNNSSTSAESGRGTCTGGPGMCQTSLAPVIGIAIEIIVVAAVLGCCFIIFNRLKE